MTYGDSELVTRRDDCEDPGCKVCNTPPARGRKGDWMQTFTGRAFWPLDPRPDDVDSEDIAHALSMICRYGGHARQWYSVAEHCVLISEALELAGEPPAVQLQGLLHDAAEAYIGDMVRPLKQFMPAYCQVDELVSAAISYRFGSDPCLPAIVKDFDNRILLNERKVLMATPPLPWVAIEDQEPLPVYLHLWSPSAAKGGFTARLYELIDPR